MTSSFQNLHEVSGLPWWALIPMTTIALRSVWTLPLAIIQRKRIQKQSQLRPIISAMQPILKLNLAKRVSKAKIEAEKNPSNLNLKQLASMSYEQILLLSTKEQRKRQKELFKKNDVQIWKNFILPAFQIPLWIIMSITMRDLSGWSTWDNLKNKPLDPSLYNEGLFWFQDLTIPDSMHVFPVLLGVITLCNVEWTFRTLQLARLTRKLKYRPTVVDAMANFSRLSIVFMMSISLYAPASLTIYWICSQIYSLIQNVLMDLFMPISRSVFKGNETKNSDTNAIDIVKANTRL